MASLSTSLTFKPSIPNFLLSLKPSPLRSHQNVINVRKPPTPTLTLTPTRAVSILPVIRRATNDHSVPGTGETIESDKLPPDVRNRTMDAVAACGRRVTTGDVSRTTGIQLSEAQIALRALAADTNAFLEVSDEGDVVYVFPKGYRANLATKSLGRNKVQPYVDKAKSAAEYGVKISMGATLVASIVLSCTTILCIFLLAAVGKNSPSGTIDQRHSSSPATYNSKEFGFFDAVCSFVFGDGGPNRGNEEKRWKLIAQYIGSKGGVVTAEELAPYLDHHLNNAPKQNDMVDHDPLYYMILPVLSKFDGQPVLDGDGNILYQFPSLQRTAAAPNVKRRRNKYGQKFFMEKKWQFSRITDKSDRRMIIGLGGINLFGVAILGLLLKDSTLFVPNGFTSFVSRLYPLLQIYAASFFLIPLVRWFFIWMANAQIEKRNRAREECARALESPDLALTMKLLSARDMFQRTIIGQDRIVYTTDRDLVELKRMRSEISDQDRRVTKKSSRK